MTNKEFADSETFDWRTFDNYPKEFAWQKKREKKEKYNLNDKSYAFILKWNFNHMGAIIGSEFQTYLLYSKPYNEQETTFHHFVFIIKFLNDKFLEI